MALPYIKTGTYAGTTAAKSVTVGFKPAWIIAYNETDGDTIWVYILGMATTTVAIVTTATGSQTVTLTLNDDGWTMPTDSVINENGKSYIYMCGTAN